MNPVELIERKRDGGELSQPEFADFIGGYLDGETVQEGQMAALLMAGVLQGFTAAEALSLTTVLLESGDQLDLGHLRGPTVDKHSTGGVGDGTTLVVAPLLAAAGLQVVKLSGRGLGHTGGTLDKLESIPGMQVRLPLGRITEIAEAVGCVVAAQTADLVPADKALYALRDVTATVPSMALIASSVMSKKLASGAGTIVLDVKAGDGAFMETADRALELAELCVSIGTGAGRNTTAIVTDMNTPLGAGIGNALEVAEVVETLSVPPEGRFAEVCLRLASLAVSKAESIDEGAARERLVGVWNDGSALDRLRRMVQAQGGDPDVCERPRDILPRAPITLEVTAGRGGAVSRIPARAVGLLSMQLGAGRMHSSDEVDPAVGIQLLVAEGEPVRQSDRLAVVHAKTQAAADAVAEDLRGLIEIADSATPAPTVLYTV